MNRALRCLIALAAVCAITSCGDPAAYTICLVDVSASITAAGFESEFAAVDGHVERMHRGDRLTLIPITGNAMGDTPGHVITLTAPMTRQPYDNDLVQFRVNAHAEISKLRAEFTCRPAKRTDLLGALAIAQDELTNVVDAESSFGGRTLYVFSDFVEDDDDYRFGADRANAPNGEAAEFARRLQEEHHIGFPATLRVRFVTLESTDLVRLSSGRLHWIREFWTAYLAPSKPRWTPIDAVAHRGLK